MNSHSENIHGWVISIIIHLLVGMAFLFANLDLKPFDLDYTPVFFVPMSEIPAENGIDQGENAGADPMIELPSRPMLDETSPLLKLPDRQKPDVVAQSVINKPDFSKQREISPSKRVSLNPVNDSIRKRASVESLPLSDEALFGQRKDMISEQIAGEEMFTITWESGPNRVKTSGGLPNFPGSVNREVKIRIAFSVSADGTIGSITPLTKGEPKLERVSVEALRTWRFNSLPSANTNQQTGIITFVFELK